MLTAKNLKEELKKINLVYVTDKRGGIMRQKIGKGFRYYDWAGQVITDEKTLERIKQLSVPPAWDNVWICSHSKGHLQATGYDEKGRKQYIYHEGWIKMCQENKFNRMVFFGGILPKIRRRVVFDMRLRGLPKRKVIATVVWLLEKTYIRVGNDEYAKDNNSYGLTTLRNRHVRIVGDKVKLEFIGKSGIKHVVSFSHPRISKIIKKCIELPGFELFQYIDEDGKREIVDSADVNEYLRNITGEDITAKDFRTWGATLLSASMLCKLGYGKDEKDLQKNIKEVIKVTASHLRNTPSVCKNYYIHPGIFRTYLDNSLEKFFGKENFQRGNTLKKHELAVLSLLKYSN